MLLLLGTPLDHRGTAHPDPEDVPRARHAIPIDHFADLTRLAAGTARARRRTQPATWGWRTRLHRAARASPRRRALPAARRRASVSPASIASIQPAGRFSRSQSSVCARSCSAVNSAKLVAMSSMVPVDSVDIVVRLTSGIWCAKFWARLPTAKGGSGPWHSLIWKGLSHAGCQASTLGTCPLWLRRPREPAGDCPTRSWPSVRRSAHGTAEHFQAVHLSGGGSGNPALPDPPPHRSRQERSAYCVRATRCDDQTRMPPGRTPTRWRVDRRDVDSAACEYPSTRRSSSSTFRPCRTRRGPKRGSVSTATGPGLAEPG